MNQVKPSQLAITISNAIAIRKPLYIHGAAGIGKSDSVRDAAKAFGGLLWDWRAALRDAVDVIGLPGAKDGITFYNLPAGLPHDASAKGILFLDELNSAPQQTQAALYQLVLDRRVGDYVLPENVHVIAAGNRSEDRGITHRMPDPLINRFMHVELVVDLNDWCAWAIANDIRPEVIAFIRMRPEMLNNHDAKRKCIAFSTPRAVATVSKILDLNSPVESQLIAGTCGDGFAVEFEPFKQLYRQMVSPDQVLLNPASAEIPKNSGIIYALCEALARRATIKNVDRVMTYAARLPAEYESCLVSSMVRRTPELSNTPEVISYACKQAA